MMVIRQKTLSQRLMALVLAMSLCVPMLSLGMGNQAHCVVAPPVNNDSADNKNTGKDIEDLFYEEAQKQFVNSDGKIDLGRWWTLIKSAPRYSSARFLISCIASEFAAPLILSFTGLNTKKSYGSLAIQSFAKPLLSALTWKTWNVLSKPQAITGKASDAVFAPIVYEGVSEFATAALIKSTEPIGSWAAAPHSKLIQGIAWLTRVGLRVITNPIVLFFLKKQISETLQKVLTITTKTTKASPAAASKTPVLCQQSQTPTTPKTPEKKNKPQRTANV